ncbi:MAG: hypothetical protein SynsKO_08450 [Synoicihabitans sp.]
MVFRSQSSRKFSRFLMGLGLIASVSLQAAPRINEVVINGTEVVEIFNPDGGAVNLLNYKLQNQGTLDYTFPSYSLPAGGYVLVHIGTGVDSGTSLYVGAVTEQLDNAGDDLVLRNAADSAIDYIAWGSGGNVDASPAGPSFTGTISIAGVGSGDSLAFHTDGVNADSAAQWIRRSGANVTLGALNTQQSAPTIEYTTASVSADVVEAFTVDLAVGYTDEAALGSATVTLQIPTGIYVVSTDGGTYNGTQISWSLGAITGGTTLSPQFRAECETSAATFAGSVLAVSYTRYSGGASSSVDAGVDSVSGTFSAPSVSVAIAEFNTGDTVIYTEDGQFVELRVTVGNGGPGDLVNGTNLTLELGNNLTLIALKNDTAAGTNVTFTQSGSDVSFTSSALASGASQEYFVRAQVEDCTQLTTTISSSWGSDDLAPGTGTCSVDTDDTVEIYCLLEMAIVNTLPSGTYAASGEIVTSTLTITNNNAVPITDGELTLTLPADYYFSSVSPGSAVNYTSGTNTVVLPAGVLGSIPAGGTKVVTLNLIPSCEAISDQTVRASLSYASGAETLLADSPDIPVRLPVFNILFEDAANPGSTTILAERGEEVTFLLSGINSGAGELNDGADMSLMLGAGYTDVQIRMGAPFPGGSAVPTSFDGTTYTWNTGSVAGGVTNLYYITATVGSCEDLDNSADYSWSVVGPVGGETCTDTNVSSSSVTIELAAPELSVTYPAIPIDYCNGGSTTIPIQNTGTGQARNVTLVLTGIPDGEFVISNPVNVSFTHVGSVVTLTLTDGSDTDFDGTTDDIAPGDTVNVGFDIDILTGGVACGAGGGSIQYQPGFEDSCDYVYTTGTAFGSYSVNNEPSMSVEIQGNSSANVGETGLTYTVTASYSGPAGTSVNFDLVADYPDASDTANGYGNFNATAASDSGVIAGGTVTWSGQTLTTPASPAFSTVTLTRTITLDAPTITCAGGNDYTVAVDLAGAATDCNGCPLIPGGGLGDNASLFINNNNDFTQAIIDNARTVSYLNVNSNGRDLSSINDEGETCTAMEFVSTLDFNPGNGITDWSDPLGTGTPITFIDDSNDALDLIIPGSGSAYKTRLNLTVTYDGVDRTSLISDSDIVETGDGTFQLDLSGLNGAPAGNQPTDGKELEITYTLESDAGSSGGVSFGRLFIDNNDADPCGNNLPEEYDQGVAVSISPAQLNVGVSKITGDTNIIDKCETATFRLNLSGAGDWSVYDGQVVVELGGNYAYGTGTTVIAGLLDENGAAIATFEPTIAGTTLTWDLGDLNDPDGTIEFEATKICGTTDTTLSAVANSNTNCNNQADASVTTRSQSDSGSYSANTLAEGNMAVVLAPETFFAKDAYPVIRFYVINSGNGKLYNAVVPIVLDADLEFVSAKFVGGAALAPTSGGAGDQNVEFTLDEVDEGEIVAVEMILRFEGCDDLDVSIVNARWGCEGDFCQSGLGDTSVIEQADSKIFVVSHTATPDTLDYCNGTAIFNVLVRNGGVVEAYEPVIREFLPTGLTLLGSPQYRINGGVWNNFPGNFTSNSAAAMGDPSSGPTGGTWYYWNFTDPNNDGSEADSLITTTDGREGDGDGRRHVVLKPGGEVEIQFEVQITDCTDGLAYFNSSKTARAAIFFDLPCDQASTDFPSASSSLNSILRPPGRSALDVQILAENNTKGTASTNTLVRGEQGDEIEITLSIEAIGVGQSPNVTMDLPLPSNLSFESIAVAAGGTGGVGFTSLSTPTVGSTGTISFTVDNSNGDAYGTSYLRPSDKLIVTILGEVLDCDSDTTVAATATFGCCDGGSLGTPAVPGASGSVVAAVDLQSRPDVPTVTILESTAFDACTGELTISIANPNPDFTLFDFDTTVTLPSGWVYDDSTASASQNGVTFEYSGSGARSSGDELTATEEEPYTGVATELRWATTNLTNGQIAPARAKVFPNETVEIKVFLRNDNCPDNTTNSSTTDFPDRYNNDTNNPDIALSNVTAGVEFEYQSSCLSGALDPQLDSVEINPDQPDLDILSITPSVAFIDGTTTSITWTVQVRNTSSEATAEGVLFGLEFGAGYSSVSRQSGVAETSSTGLEFEWDDAFTVATTTTTTWTFQANINVATRGDLSVTANLDGRCYDLNGDFFCNYSDDYLKTFVTGAAITKITDGTELALPAISTPTANDDDAVTADLTIGSIVRNVLIIELYEGGSSDVKITDELPTGFSFLEANGRFSTSGPWTTLTNSGTGLNVILENQPLLDDISGGASVLGDTALFIEIWSQVDDDTTNNLIGGSKTNTAELEVTRGSFVVSHDDPSGVDLQDTNEFTIIEPRLTGATKVSDPVSGDAGSPNVIDLSTDPNTIEYTVEVSNTGTSPAYETIFTDAIPFGMDVSAAVVTITRGGTAPVDTLTEGVDYVFGFTAGTGGNPGLMTLTFEDTTLANVEPTDVVTIVYTGSITGAAPGQQLYNSATFSGYSSLPSTGATLTTGTSTTLNESSEERDSYGSTFLPPTPVVTYHTLFGELVATKLVSNEITLPDGGGVATDYRGGDLTRVTVGERVIYQARLGVPPFLTIYEPRIEDVVPDGLTVRKLAWEVVDPGDPLTDGATIITANIDNPTESSGTTPVAQDNDSTDGVALPDSITGGATGQELLLQVEATLDQVFDGGGVIDTEEFANTTVFRWAGFTDGPRDDSVTTDPVEFTAVVPAIATVNKTLETHQDSSSALVAPVTATANSLFGEGLTGSQSDTLIVRPGDLLEYKLTFTNSGSAIAYDVVLEDALPAIGTIDFATDAPNGFNYYTDGTHNPAVVASSGTTAFSSAPAITDNLISLTLDEVAIGATVEVTYWLQVQDDLSADAFFQTRADITDYRSLPTTTVFGATANVPRTMTSTPAAFTPIDYAYLGVVTPVPVFTNEFTSSITAPTPGTFLSDDTGRATIGEEITYRMTIDIEDDLALYDLKLTNQNSGGNSYLQVPSGLTVRKAAYTLGGAAEVALTIPSKQGNGSTRLTLPSSIDVLDSAVTGDPEFSLLVYATLDTENLAGTVSTDDNDSNGRLSLGDRLSIRPRFAWNQWDDVNDRNVETLGWRRFFVLEPGLSGFEKTLDSTVTSGTGNDYINFYGEGPDTPAGLVDNVPLFMPGDTLTYSAEFTNLTTGNDGTTAYNVVLVDRIPKGVTYTGGSVSHDSAVGTLTETVTTPSVLDPTHMAQDVEFAFDEIGPGETVTVTYDVTVDDPVAAGRYLQNRMDLTDYSTLPTGYTGVAAHTGVVESNERDTDSDNPYNDLGPDYAFAGVPYPSTYSKTIETELSAPSGKLTNGTSRATIGELVTYELIVDIPDGSALHDFYLFDELPDGMTVVPALMSYTLNGTPGLTAGLLNDGDREVGLALGDLEGTAAVDELILIIAATVDPFLDSSASTALEAGDTLANGFTFSWNQVDVDPDPTVNLSTDARTTVIEVTVAEVELTLEEPDLDSSLTKAQINVQDGGSLGGAEISRGTDTFYSFAAGGGPDGVTVTTHADVEVTLPDDRIVYTLEVENTGDASAFDIVLRDVLPADDAIDYLSGTGTDTAGGGSTWSGSFAGTTGSQLTIASSSTGAGIDTSTQLDFTIDFLAAGDTATIKYMTQIDRDIGAGRYLGTNEVRLVDYGSLPDGTLGVDVGNLTSGNTVEDNSLERDSDSAADGDPAPYTDQGPVELELGVEFPALAKTVTRLYDDEGFYNPALVNANDVMRVGELLKTTLTVTLPRYTRLFDGGASAALFRDILPAGQTYTAETVEAVVYPNYATEALDLSPFTPVVSTTATAGVQTVSLNFSDIINSTGSSIDGAVEFLTEIKPLAADGANLLTDTTAQLSGFNQANLFWNTHDTQAQRTNEVASSSLTTATDDVPWLGEDGPIVLTRQPNLSLAKTASIADGSTVGATAGVGDVVTYTLTTSNAAAGSFSGIAYDVALSDALPRNIAPLALADVTTATAGGRALVKDEDYTFAYTYDATTRKGTIDFQIQQDAGNSDFDGRLEPGEDLVVTYDLTVNPNIGGEGSGVGLMANRANVTESQSFPGGVNDADRKTFDPVGPVSHTLVTPTPLVTKTSVNADASVTVGDVITYTITAPASLIRANLYQVEIRDELPEGLSFGGTGTTGPTAAGTVTLDVGGTSGAGNDVTVVGGSGNVTINIPDDRTLSVLIDLIANDDGTAATVDQVTVTLQAVVQSTFSNSAPIPRLHAFENYAELYWFNSDVADAVFTGRNRFLVLSDKVTHYFEAFGILLEPDNQGVGVPGEIKTYRHTLRNFQSTAANVPLTWSSTLGWTWVAYIGDGEGNIVSGPYQPDDTFAVAGDGSTEIIMQAFIPAPSTAFTTDVLTLTAFGPPDYVEAVGGGDQDISVYDTTVVQSPGVVIRKDISEDDGATYDTRLEVDPDDADRITQRLRFINNSPEPVKEIYVYDFVPEYTAYVAGTAVNDGTYALSYSTDGGQSWTNGEPGGVSDSVTNLRWYFSGGAALPPGVEHTITFKLRVK